MNKEKPYRPSSPELDNALNTMSWEQRRSSLMRETVVELKKMSEEEFNKKLWESTQALIKVILKASKIPNNVGDPVNIPKEINEIKPNEKVIITDITPAEVDYHEIPSRKGLTIKGVIENEKGEKRDIEIKIPEEIYYLVTDCDLEETCLDNENLEMLRLLGTKKALENDIKKFKSLESCLSDAGVDLKEPKIFK